MTVTDKPIPVYVQVLNDLFCKGIISYNQFRELQGAGKCDHWFTDISMERYISAKELGANFCPQCGEKLMTESISNREKTADDQICEQL